MLYNEKDLISGIVRQGKIWEEDHIRLWKKYYVPGTDILDIGANMGLSSLAFHKKHGITGTVHLFEPQYHAMFICSYNTKQIPRKKLYCFALSDKFYILKYESVYSNIGATDIRENQDKEFIEHVSGVPLDSIDFKNKIYFIKMDVEGFEESVVRGAL